MTQPADGEEVCATCEAIGIELDALAERLPEGYVYLGGGRFRFEVTDDWIVLTVNRRKEAE